MNFEHRVRVKICGMQDLKTALAAVAAGADALGFVFAASPRRISPARAKDIITALPPFIAKVGVFVNSSPEEIKEIVNFCGLDVIQLHGNEPPEYCHLFQQKIIKAFRIKDKVDQIEINCYQADAVLLDTYIPDLPGGSGRCFDWRLASELSRQVPLILAGGLEPENVQEAIRQVRPYAVDVSSGVETGGQKDIGKIRLFIERVKG